MTYLNRIAELNEGWKPEWNLLDYYNYILVYGYANNGNKYKPAGWSIIQFQASEYYFKSAEIGTQLLKEFTEEDLKLILLEK